ncbi:hypothetical protein V8C37DRAFT_402672 [Trichoderma ceciliae]
MSKAYFLAQKALPRVPPGLRIICISTGGAVEQMTRVLAKCTIVFFKGKAEGLVNAIKS